MADKGVSVSAKSIESKILLIRGAKVMLDADLAELYGVEIRRLNEQVRRNIERFPEGFMFQLTADEYESLISQFATLKTGRGQHRIYMPYAFTEHGALMLGNVLKSEQAVEMSLMVVRSFVRMRELVAGNKELAQKLNHLERKVGAHDKAIAEIIKAIRQLMTPEEPKKETPHQFCTVERKIEPVSELFATTIPNANTHIRKILKEGELAEDSVIKESLITVADGKNYRTKLCLLEMILARIREIGVLAAHLISWCFGPLLV